jgi:hypothetical protein
VDARTTTLLDISSDLLNNEVAKPDNLDTKSLISLSSVNKYAQSGLFKPAFFQHLKKGIQRSAKKQVELLLKINLNFDASHLRALCQKVLREGDIDLLKVLTKGREAVLKEIELPKKLIDETNTYDFSAVIAAIESGKSIEDVLAKMRTDLERIVKEKGFPFQALLNAYEIYDKKFDPWTAEQCKIFSVKVVGYLQRLSPAWLKKALATGIYNITEEGKACGDTFILQRGESIDPATDAPNKGLGFDFCVNIVGALWWACGGCMHSWSGVSSLFEKLFKAKTAELGEFMQRPQNRKTGPCVIL